MLKAESLDSSVTAFRRGSGECNIHFASEAFDWIATHAWEFEKGGAPVTTTVTGPLVIDDTSLAIQGALAGLGIALAYEDQVADYIAEGKLIRVLEDWSPSFPGFFIYYPDRRHQSAALSALMRALRVT